MPEIPKIQIPEIQIRAIPEPHVLPPPVTQNLAPRPIYEVPGCARVHRDAHLIPSLLRDDPNGVGIACPEGQLPSYTPMDWDPKKLQIIEPEPAQNQQQEQPPAGQKTKPKPPPEEKPPPGKLHPHLEELLASQAAMVPSQHVAGPALVLPAVHPLLPAGHHW